MLGKFKKGFTLIELLVSISLILIVMVGIFTFFISTYKANNSVNDEMEIQSQGEKAINFIMDTSIDGYGVYGEVADNNTDKTLFKIKKTDGYYCIYKLKDNKLYYIKSSDKDDEPTQKISELINSIELTPLLSSDNTFANAKGIKITIKLGKKDITKTITNEVYFRNK